MGYLLATPQPVRQTATDSDSDGGDGHTPQGATNQRLTHHPSGSLQVVGANGMSYLHRKTHRCRHAQSAHQPTSSLYQSDGC